MCVSLDIVSSGRNIVSKWYFCVKIWLVSEECFAVKLSQVSYLGSYESSSVRISYQKSGLNYPEWENMTTLNVQVYFLVDIPYIESRNMKTSTPENSHNINWLLRTEDFRNKDWLLVVCRQGGAICPKNSKIVLYHRLARIPKLADPVPDSGSRLAIIFRR